MNASSSCSNAPVTVTYRIAGEKVTSSAGEETVEAFKGEIEYLHPFVMRIGRSLRMRSIDYGLFREDASWIGFRFSGEGEAEVAEAGGVVSTAPASLGEILRILDEA